MAVKRLSEIRKQKSATPKASYSYDPASIYDPKKNKAKINQIASLQNKDISINKEIPNANIPTQTPPTTLSQPKPYTPIMGDPNQIKQLMSSIQSKQYRYDPTTDPLLQSAQQQAMGEVAKAGARRGMLFSEGTKSRMGQTAMQLVPQFEQRAYERYRGGLGDLYNQLQTIQGVEQKGYDRYRTTEQDRMAREKQQRLIGEQEQARTEKQEIRDYGVTLSPIMRDYQRQFAQIPQQDLARIMPYQQDFAARINELMAIDPNHPDIQLLQIARAMKVLSNPKLLQQYGIEYGMRTGATRGMAEKQEQTREKNEIDNLKKTAETFREFEEIDRISKQIDKLDAEIKYTDAKTATEEVNKLIKDIEKSWLPEEKKRKLEQITNDIFVSQGRLAISQGQLGLAERKFEAEYEKQPDGSYVKKSDPNKNLDVKEYIKMARSMVDEKQRTFRGYDKYVYTDQDIAEWVQSLPLTIAEKEEIYNKAIPIEGKRKEPKKIEIPKEGE